MLKILLPFSHTALQSWVCAACYVTRFRIRFVSSNWAKIPNVRLWWVQYTKML